MTTTALTTEQRRTALTAMIAGQTGKKRIIGEAELTKFLGLCENPDYGGKEIRVYSDDGFLPNSYKWKATINYLCRFYDGDGNEVVAISSTGAQRSHGRGSLVTVNGRAI